MSDFYDDVPDHRMAYDRDGTQVYYIDPSNVVTVLTAGQILNINDENNSSSVVTGLQTEDILFLFPEIRDLSAMFVSSTTIGGTPIPITVKTSPDSTNGIDGTWTTVTTFNADILTQPSFRTNISACVSTGVKAVKAHISDQGYTASLHTIHVYGQIAAGQNPDRLLMWQTVTDAQVDASYFDMEDTPRLSSADKTFRVKNNSATLTAVAPVVSFDTVADISPSIPGRYTVSQGGGFAATQTLSDLAPGATSSALTIRRTTSADAVLSLMCFRVLAIAASWV